jgi:hypothetical protein
MKAVGWLKTGIFERVNCLGRCSVLVRAGLLPQRRMQERYLLIPPQEPPPGVPFSVLLFFVRFGSSFPGGERHRFSPVAGRPRFAVRASRQSRSAQFNYAAEVANAIGSTIKGSSFSGLLTLALIGHIRMGSAGNGRIKSRGSGSSLSQRT